MAQVPVIGSLFNADFAQGPESAQTGYVPQPLQPGGPFTPVTTPLQDQGALVGPVYLGCGHSMNALEVMSCAIEVGGVPTQSAVLRCCLCGYVTRIITPFADLYNLDNALLFS